MRFVSQVPAKPRTHKNILFSVYLYPPCRFQESQEPQPARVSFNDSFRFLRPQTMLEGKDERYFRPRRPRGYWFTPRTDGVLSPPPPLQHITRDAGEQTSAMVESLLGMLALIMVATQFVAASPALITLPNPPYLLPLNSDARSATILGVDSQLGQTTYAINQDAEEGGTREVLTATLVQGADHAMYTLSLVNGVAFGYDCVFSGGSAVCSNTDGSFVSTMALQSELVLDIPVTGSPSATGPTPSALRAEDTSSTQKTSASTLGALVGLAFGAYGLL
ncbi:hypothetical protein C8R47DRAFT_1156003 [Mycena vitilis]|nr:hypothetical protein C8R47DRAFT_1156003 [Mycena vitilis]